jgi:mRNA interferase MazF
LAASGVKRGELWTISGGPGFAGKPRPALVVQNDIYPETATVTICPITSDGMQTLVLRQAVEPDDLNGLRRSSRVMIDKVTTLPRSRLGQRIGTLSDEDMTRIDRALLVFLRLAD